MGFPRREATIKQVDGRIVCHITAGGSFVSSTVHDSVIKAKGYAASKRCVVIVNEVQAP